MTITVNRLQLAAFNITQRILAKVARYLFRFVRKKGASYRTLRCGNYIILFIMGVWAGKGKGKGAFKHVKLKGKKGGFLPAQE